MGAKAKKALKKSLKKAASKRTDKPSDFLPLEGGPGKRLPVEEVEPIETTSTVLYIGHIPHGFYEEQMEGFFRQFGKIKRLRIARNKKTGRSKHYGFIEFESPEVAKVVAETINGYLLFEHTLQVQLLPPNRVHPKLWRGVNSKSAPADLTEIERRRHNKVKTLAEHQKLVDNILKRDERRRKRILAAGIDYECPPLVGLLKPAAKKIKFTDDNEEEYQVSN